MIDKKQARIRRSRQTRRKIAELGAARLLVHRSNTHMYAQVVDAEAKVVASASTLEPEMRKQVGNGGNVKAAALIGKNHVICVSSSTDDLAAVDSELVAITVNEAGNQPPVLASIRMWPMRAVFFSL